MDFMIGGFKNHFASSADP